MNDTLCIGDIVCLYSAESYGYVFASESSSVHNEVAVGARQDRLRPDFKDQHVFAFEICVANRYKLNKQHRKLKDKLEEDENNMNLRSQVHLAQLFYFRGKIHRPFDVNTSSQSGEKVAAKAENEDNELEQKRQQGKKVVYGQVIQLRHLFTNKYIHVSSTAMSSTESNNMAVKLLSYHAKHAQLRIMPRYKVKAEGDVVQVDDQIVFESVKSTGQYLHVSKQHLGDNSHYSKSYELNLSVQQSGFTVYRKYKPAPDDDNKVKVGGLIRFYHKEMEAYLVAEGLFNDELTEDVHLRMRPVDQSQPKTMFPSSSAITYWQIELQEGPVSGGVLKWEQQCKLVHLCTRKYLAVDQSGKVTLISDHLDPRTVFRLHPVIRESDDIPLGSYCRIQHVVTKQWLHACTEEHKRKQEAKSDDSKSMSSLKWSTAQLKKIDVIEEKQYDDVFTIQEVEQELVDIFHFMAGMVPFIQKLVADKKENKLLNALMAHKVSTALKEMKNFMLKDGEPIKPRQKLMRNLRIVELLVNLLKIPIKGPDQYHLTRIFMDAYDVLSAYLVGDSRKNELYIAKYIDFFLTQFDIKEGKIGLHAAHMVMELIRDNRRIVDRITHDHIDNFVDLLRKEKNYRYLDLLVVLCVCDGVSIADNQKYITEVWLMRGSRDCVYFTELGEKIGQAQGVVYVSTDGQNWDELNDFAHRSREDDEYLFLEHQLELFGFLCHGQHEFSIKVITQELNYLTWEEAFISLSDERLPAQLRAKYCDLITTMFVDISDNHSVVGQVRLSFIYEDVGSAENQVDISNSSTSRYFPQLSTWISEFLGKNGDMVASNIGNNMLSQQVLRLVHYLVSFGFYSKLSDINMLLKPLSLMVDGRDDMPFPNCEGKENDEIVQSFKTKERFEQSPETKAVVDAKLQAMEVLDLFFNYIFNMRLAKFISMFKETYVKANTPNQGDPELGPMLKKTFDIITNQSVVRIALRKLNEIFENTALLKDYPVVEILMDLSKYEYDDMVRKSMHLLNRYYSTHSSLFTRAVQAQVLITDGSVNVLKRLDERLPVLRRLAISKLGDSEARELCDILDEFIFMCHLDGDDEEPHGMNQNILYNNGVLEDTLTILSQEIDVKLLDQYTGLRRVFQRTFTLLKMMAHKNATVQGRLFDRLDLLLSKEGAAPELAEALTEVFKGNRNTCMRIMQHQVHKIMVLVAEHKSAVPQFLDLLNAIVKGEELGLPLKRNQGLVMTYFMQFRADVAFVIDQDEKAREAILTSSHHPDLNYLISIVDLLAACAEGENRFIESVCQTIFKIPELLKILNHPNISDNLKRPFLRFFLWVYLNTASGMIESGAGDIPHDNAMWGYLNSLSGTLQVVTEYARNNNDTVKQLLRSSPGKSRIKTARARTARGRGKVPADAGRGYVSLMSDQPVDRPETMQGSLHYLFDAVMPFLQIFCRTYYQPDAAMFPKEPEYMDALAHSFKSFLEVIAPLISIESQMKKLIKCMRALFSSTTLPTEEMEAFQDQYGQGVSSHDVRSDARKEYEDLYSTEEEINRMLNIFTVNMQAAYGGVNDVQTQIGFPSRKQYSEIGGDEELPLGAEFQEHLRCFINPVEKHFRDKYQMAEKLVLQLKLSKTLMHLNEIQRLEQIELNIKCFQLLRGLIHNEIVKLPPDFENDIKASSEQLKVVEGVQSALNSFGTITSVLDHLSSPQDKIYQELLAFLAALLFNGNEDVQTSMFEYFTGTREETFFFAIKNRMKLSATATRERRVLHAMHQAKVEEEMAQIKALRNAMASGKMAEEQIRAANKITSQLTLAVQRSHASFRSSLSRGEGRTPQSRMKSAKSPGPNISSGLELKPLKASRIGFGTNATNKVTPMAEVEINIQDMGNDEIEELMTQNRNPDLEFKDDGYIELVLRILGLMCDNQYRGLQDYLREQPDNIKSVNLVAETTRFLSILYSSVNDKSVDLIIQLFDTLVEFTSGNSVNQSTVFENKICDYINHILRVGIYKDCSTEKIYSLKRSIGILIKSLTEENPKVKVDDDNGEELPKEVMENINTDTLVTVMMEAYSDSQRKEKDFEENQNLMSEVGFLYFHIIKRKMDLKEDLTLEALIKKDEDMVVWNFFDENTLSIEILKDNVLQKLYFRVKDKNVLREEIKEKFKYEVDRSSPSNKLRDFMDWSSDIIKDIKYQRKVHANLIGRLLVKLWLPMNILVMLVTLAITMLVLVSWRAGDEGTELYIPSYAYSDGKTVMYSLGGVHNFLSLCIFISYVISNRPTFPSFGDVTQLFKKRDEGMEEEQDMSWNKKKGESHLEVKAYGMKTIYYLIFMACSAAGTAIHGYFFAFHLLHLPELNQLLKRVIQAVTTNGRSLLMVALLGLGIFYIYALFLFAFYRGWMFKDDRGRHCNTMYQCFVAVIHHGLVGGPYTTFEQEMGNNFDAALGIAAFDVTFFIIIQTIGLNIIFGIIVDTFSQLRDSKWEIDRDMKTNCFICSRESYDFERQGWGFEKHVKTEHNQWAYLFFFIHLDETRPNDYSALELYVYKLLLAANFDFFPLNRSLSLENEVNTEEQKLEMMQQQVEYLVNKMKEQEAEKERDKERKRQLEWEEKHKNVKK